MNRIVRNAFLLIAQLHYQKKGYSQMAAKNMAWSYFKEKHSGVYPKDIIRFSAQHGFLPSTVVALEITKNNYRDYLSDNDYYKLYPLDGEYHSWIDNKLELKYLLGELSYIMPDYYFQTMQDGSIIRLLDCSDKYSSSIQGLLQLLNEKKVLGFKSIRGCGGIGFYRIEYLSNDILVNDVVYSETEFESFVKKHPNFIVMEYLETWGLPAKIYGKTANSIRCIIGIEGNKKYNIGSFIKFGDKKSGYVDNLTGGGISCPIDEKGEFVCGFTKVHGVMKEIYEHPDTHVQLKGKLEEWDEIQNVINLIVNRLPQLTYMGFDFVITKNGIRLLEINDRSGLLTIQKATPLMKNKVDNFYQIRLEKLKSI